MGLRPCSRADRKLVFCVFCCGFFPPLIHSSPRVSLAAQLLRPWPSWCCNASSFFSFDLLFSEFPWSPACEPLILQLDASAWSCWFCPCSTVDLARSFFHSKGLKTTLLQKCLSRELFVSVTTAINAWFTNLCQQTRNTFTWCQNYSYLFQQLLLNIHLTLQNRNFSVHFSSYRLFFNLWHIGWMFELGDGK